MEQLPLTLGPKPSTIPEAILGRKGPGRPSKMEPAKLELLRQAFAVDATIEEASFYAGIHATTYYNWKKEEPELFEELERLRLTPILTARQTIVTSLKSPEGARWFIERKRSDEFATKSKTEHSGKIETPDQGANAETVRALALEYEEKMKQAIIDGRTKTP